MAKMVKLSESTGRRWKRVMSVDGETYIYSVEHKFMSAMIKIRAYLQ